jgi:hypothetical protein
MRRNKKTVGTPPPSLPALLWMGECLQYISQQFWQAVRKEIEAMIHTPPVRQENKNQALATP